jgi:acyl carrier protein
MSEQEIYSLLTKVFRDVFDDDGIELTSETTANDIEEWDSFAHIRLIVATEKTFAIRFTTAEINNLQNVGEFVGLIAEKKAA